MAIICDVFINICYVFLYSYTFNQLLKQQLFSEIMKVSLNYTGYHYTYITTVKCKNRV